MFLYLNIINVHRNVPAPKVVANNPKSGGCRWSINTFIAFSTLWFATPINTNLLLIWESRCLTFCIWFESSWNALQALIGSFSKRVFILSLQRRMLMLKTMVLMCRWKVVWQQQSGVDIISPPRQQLPSPLTRVYAESLSIGEGQRQLIRVVFVKDRQCFGLYSSQPLARKYVSTTFLMSNKIMLFKL